MASNRAQLIRDELARRQSSSSNQDNQQAQPGMQNFMQAAGIGQPSMPQNFAAGMLNSIQNVFKSLSDLAPSQGRNPFLYNKNESPANTFDAYKAMGTEDKPWNTPEGAAQTAGELFLPGKVVGKALSYASKPISTVKNALTKVNHEEVGKGIQATHDALESKANKLFNEVQSEAEIRGISQVNIDPKLIEEMEQYLPKTRATTKLIDKAKTGDYAALRKAQSELWHRGTARKSSILPSENDLGEEILDLRERINESIGKHLKKTGHDDLNTKLSEARNYWKDLKDTYFGEHTPNAISNLVQKNLRKIPDNLMKTLGEKSEPMQRIRDANPFVDQRLEQLVKKQNAIKNLKNAGVGAAVLTGATGLGSLGKKTFNALTE